MEKCLRKYKVLLIFMLMSIRKSINLLLPNSAPLTNVSLQFALSLSKGPGPKWRSLDSISQCSWRGRSLRLRCKEPSLPFGN